LLRIRYQIQYGSAGKAKFLSLKQEYWSLFFIISVLFLRKYLNFLKRQTGTIRKESQVTVPVLKNFLFIYSFFSLVDFFLRIFDSCMMKIENCTRPKEGIRE